MGRVAVAVAAALAGAAAGLVLGLSQGSHYEASALLRVLTERLLNERPADVQAATYAALVEKRAFLQQVRSQVAAGALTVDELADRVDGRNEPGTALVEIAAAGDKEIDARALAADLAGALIASVQQTEQARSLQVEDELRRRIAVLEGDIAAAEGDPARQESLRVQREALAAQLARLTETGLAFAGRLIVAAPAAEAHEVRARWWAWTLAGSALGLLAFVPTGARRPRPARTRLLAPTAGASLRGAISVETDPAGAPVEWSADGRTWEPLRADELPDGRHLLRAAGTREATPVVVDNTAPTVALAPPRLAQGVVLLDAEAEDGGSGVESVMFMVSTGGPKWTEIPAEFVPERPGLYWFVAVAVDRAGNRTASDPAPLRVEASL